MVEETVALAVTHHLETSQMLEELAELRQVLAAEEAEAEDPVRLRSTVHLAEEPVEQVDPDRLFFTFCSNVILSPQKILRRREERSIEYHLSKGD
jgi:hypothetical protein